MAPSSAPPVPRFPPRLLAARSRAEQIIEDYPELEKDDVLAVYDFAAQMGRRVAL